MASFATLIADPEITEAPRSDEAAAQAPAVPAASAPPEPLLSICVLTYQRPDLLARALRSIGPLPADVEVLVSDNSPQDDGSEAIARAILAAAPPTQWRYDRNPPGGSVLTNTTNCLGRARGQYIYMLHDDDYLLPQRLDLLLRTLQAVRGRHEVVLFDVDLVNMDQQVLRHQTLRQAGYLPPVVALKKVLTNSSYVRIPAIVVSRRAFQEHGPLDSSLEGAFDTDLWVHFFARYGVWQVKQRLAAYTIHEGALTSKTFNAHSIELLLRIFAKARQQQVLSEEEVRRAQAQYFHQFVLAGTYRALLRRDWRGGREVLALLKQPSLRQLPVPLRWQPVRWAFSLLTFWA